MAIKKKDYNHKEIFNFSAAMYESFIPISKLQPSFGDKCLVEVKGTNDFGVHNGIVLCYYLKYKNKGVFVEANHIETEYKMCWDEEHEKLIFPENFELSGNTRTHYNQKQYTKWLPLPVTNKQYGLLPKCVKCGKLATSKLGNDVDLKGIGVCEEHKSQITMALIIAKSEKEFQKILKKIK